MKMSNFKRDYRTKAYSEGEKTKPSIKSINILEKYSLPFDKRENQHNKEAFSNALSELENIARAKHGILEINLNNQHAYAHLTLTLPFINRIDFKILENLSLLAHCVSIEPLDSEYISLHIIFSNTKL